MNALQTHHEAEKAEVSKADMMLLQVELQDALGDTNRILSHTELLEFHRSLWMKENQHSTGMPPSSFPLSRYVDSETGEIHLDAVQKLAEHIKDIEERKIKEVGPVVRKILEQGK